MMKLSEEHGVEACISKTTSYEYWDETPPSTKIESMAEYLHDVSIANLEVRKLAHVKAVQNPLED
jgi:D-amino-acid oxidase